MQFNRKGMALMMVLGLMGIGAVLMVTVSTVLATYTRQVRAYQSTDRSIHYAQMGLDEVKWNMLKEYKQWLYESTHNVGTNGPDFDVTVNPADYNDLPRSDWANYDKSGEYIYEAVDTKGFDTAIFSRYEYYQQTYWIKVINSYIQSDGKMYDPSTSGLNPRIIGRVEVWMRVAEHDPDATKFSHRYDIFCRGTEYTGGYVSYDKSTGKLVIDPKTKERHAHIRANAQNPDSISISEFVVAIFQGLLNVGSGYNVYGKMHSKDRIQFNDASNDYNTVCKIYNVMSSSTGFQFASTAPSICDDKTLKRVTKQEIINANVNTTATLTNANPVKQRTYGFHYRASSTDYAYAVFHGLGRPEKVGEISPKTESHFANVRTVARTSGLWLENGDAQYVYFDPGDLQKNGDGKVKIKTLSGKLWLNGKIVLNTPGTYEVFIQEQPGTTSAFLNFPVVYVDGNPSTAEYGTNGNTECAKTAYKQIDRGIYVTKGIRGISGVVDGQVSVYSGYDVVIAGDIIYQEFARIIQFTHKNMNDLGKIDQPYKESGGGLPATVDPESNKPNLVGVNAKNSIILPADLFSYDGMVSTDAYNGKVANRIDGQGTGIITSTGDMGSGGSGDTTGLPDVFTFGVYYAGMRMYGETKSRTSYTVPNPGGGTTTKYDTYDRPDFKLSGKTKVHVEKKGTWYIYGSVSSGQQVYATLGDYGFKYRNYQYDPNLFTFQPPMTMQISTLPVWSWRLTSGFPDGLTKKK